jgi:hypothetical protein
MGPSFGIGEEENEGWIGFDESERENQGEGFRKPPTQLYSGK